MSVDAPAPLNQSDLRVANAWRVLQNVRTAGTTSRTRIAFETGLTATTVHRLIAELRAKRLLISVGPEERQSAGRPSSMFEFNGGVAYVIGIDVGNETTRAALADLERTVLAREERPTASIEEDLLGGLEVMVSELLRSSHVRADALVGVGVGVPAVTEPGGAILRPSMHRLWEGLQLGGQLRRYLGCEVVVEQDDHLAALAELGRGGLVGVRNGLVLNAGKGVGAGIVVDGVVYHGAHAAAGRLAWITVPCGESGSSDGASAGVSAGADGAADGDGAAEGDGAADGLRNGVAPLGQLLTADGLIGDYRRLGGEAPVTGAVDVFRADADGDPAATSAVDLFADRLGWLIAAAVSLIDPQRVVMGGGISRSFDRLAPRATARLAEIVVGPPPVAASKLGTEAVVAGAIDAALQLADSWLLQRVAS